MTACADAVPITVSVVLVPAFLVTTITAALALVNVAAVAGLVKDVGVHKSVVAALPVCVTTSSVHVLQENSMATRT